MTLIRTASDGFVNQAQPTQNYGGTAKLWVTSAASAEKLAYVFFKPPFPLGATVFSAKLRVFAYGAWAGTQVLTAKRIVAKWAEPTINYTNRPSITATNQATLTVVGAADQQQLELDVTAMMNDVAGGAAFFGFQLSLSTTSTRQAHSSESPTASLRPQLEITYSSPPNIPVGLAPGGGNVIDAAKPILAWTYGDRDVGGSQSSSQVQISTSSSFATPEYDSGKVANVLNQWDLGPTAYAGVPAAATRFWRVQVWDDTDLVSGWSDPVSFVRTAKGALSLVNPTTAIFDDLTLTVKWSLTGAVQEAYRIIVRNVSPSASRLAIAPTVVHDTGRVTDPTAAYTIPARQPDIPGRTGTLKGQPILNDHDTFQIEVRVWDTVDRQSISGDPAYYSVTTANLTYTRSGVPLPVTALTATLPNAVGPVVQLDWSRATQPDWFALKVDGVVVQARIDPATVFVSGTSYRMLYAGVSPRVAHTFEIEAVVSNAGDMQHSSGNSTASQTTSPTGIWLVDEDDGLGVRIAGNDDATIAIGESATTFDLVGSRVPVRIVDALRGYEGSMTGRLTSKADRDTFLTLKGRLKPLRLVVSDMSLLVGLEEVAVSPSPLPKDRLYNCSFSFFQVDGFTFSIAGA